MAISSGFENVHCRTYLLNFVVKYLSIYYLVLQLCSLITTYIYQNKKKPSSQSHILLNLSTKQSEYCTFNWYVNYLIFIFLIKYPIRTGTVYWTNSNNSLHKKLEHIQFS